MIKLIFEMIVRMVTGSAFGEPTVGIKVAGFDVCGKGHYFKTKDGGCKYCKTPVKNYADVDFAVKVKSKKDELMESLNYLKSKSKRTKQDNESIYTLEMVLKNMK
jgi:hypothetical protein